MTAKIDTLQAEMKAAHQNVLNTFASVDIPVETMRLELNVNYGYDFTINVRDDKYNWSGDIVRVYAKFDYDYKLDEPKGDVTMTFNYGSGGWNEGFTAQEVLKVAAAAMSAAAQVVEIAEQNTDVLIDAIRNYYAAQDAYGEEATRLRDEERARKMKVVEDAFAPLISTFHPVDKDDVEAALYAADHYGDFHGFVVETYEDGLSIYPVYYEREKYGSRSTYKKDHDRIAGDDIYNELKLRTVYINDLGLSRWKMGQLSRTRFNTVKEFRDAVKSMQEENV